MPSSLLDINLESLITLDINTTEDAKNQQELRTQDKESVICLISSTARRKFTYKSKQKEDQTDAARRTSGMSNVHFISSSGVRRKGFLHWIS
ncbi:hypothetical protein Peur_044848 [Populus x canadensis]